MLRWQDMLKPAEIDRIAEMKIARRELVQEYKRIYDRCRKRLKVVG